MDEIDSTSARADRPASAGPRSGFRLHHIRTDEALARFAGDEARLRHWLLDFRQYGSAQTAAIAQSIDSGDNQSAIARAHAMKGRTGMLGMAELHSIAQSLELALRNGEPSGFWLDELSRTVVETQEEISAVLGGD